MFAKKNMRIIALIAIFVMGVVALQAARIDVFVNMDGSGWWELDLAPGGPVFCDWYYGVNHATNFYEADFFDCWGQSHLGSDYDSGTVIPLYDYMFYLDLSGSEQVPDPEPNNE